MKKTLIICAVFALALGVTAGVTACDAADAAAKAITDKAAVDLKAAQDKATADALAAKAAFEKVIAEYNDFVDRYSDSPLMTEAKKIKKQTDQYLNNIK